MSATDVAGLQVALGQVPLFQGLSSGDLDALAGAACYRQVPEGAVLFRRGDPGDGLWLILDGQIRIRLRSAEGAEVVLNHLGPGDTVGEIAALDGGARSAEAVALTPLRALFLERGPALAVLGGRPAALLRLLEALCARLRATSAQVEDAADSALRRDRRHADEVAEAIDRNPLTHLPGNQAVRAAVERLAAPAAAARALCYLDLDHFKPFNDRFGFRTGDVALARCADALRRHFGARGDGFIGHIGGDDFFLGLSLGLSPGPAGAAGLRPRLAAMRADFMAGVAEFHTEAERAAGRFAGKDRDGQPRDFPLLGCSIAVLQLAPGEGMAPAAVGARIAALKSAAKAAPDGIAAG
ncbi:cyclic nucleotide-binding domain-containing protein [Falsiroseomonas selenitidurans]|uniref:Cyclic nucleotide-binding domain-containing protein n=1 Tax=Falsiroseomonas selenitidurans TaxID=2716335 RepID=A0ABX1EAI6_9PROT|nr:cyclic nucleotide-binding domain-containing protein [Falsiroseomonas selenitidurans]NKC34234.1 cyclic nucleotide-binding domain-containing protein [Falsiroseomonas selenitidurans]